MSSSNSPSDVQLRRLVTLLRENPALIAFGVAMWLVSVGLLAAYGYSLETLILWVASLAIVVQVTRSADANQRLRITEPVRELIAAAGLLAVFAPLYLLFLHELPHQVVTDEISVMIYEQQTLERPINPLGISPYAGFPSLLLVVTSRLGALFGGINLANMRLVHAAFGLLIILLAYAFFRLNLPRAQALGATVFMGANHALLGISRLAEWANLSVLVELLALGVLLVGLRRRSIFLAALGGLFAGLTFYVYLPARITFVIWLLFLGVRWLLHKDLQTRRLIVRLGAVSAIVCIMVAAPPTVLQLRDTRPGADYYKAGLLIFPEGRELQRDWFRAGTVQEGLRINIANGLTAFNNQEHDRGFIYENHGHGFLDPLTGILLWIGVWVALRRLRRRDQPMDGDVLALTGFASLWLTFSFVINQTPNYNRMLVVLPFVAYLAVLGLSHLAQQPLLPKIRLPDSMRWLAGHEWFAVGTAIILTWNALIYADYLQNGFSRGNVVGATARYLEARTWDSEHTIHLFADEDYPYFPWGGEQQWREWIGLFKGAGQRLDFEDPEDCPDAGMDPPFTAFMPGEVWEFCRNSIAENYPTYQVHPMLPDRSRLAVEVRQ